MSAAIARAIMRRANSGLVANPTSLGMPAASHRARSSAHSFGRYDQHRFPIGQGLDHIRATQIARGRLVPLHVREQPLRAPRPGVAEMLGQLPAVLAFHRTQKTLEIQPGLPTRLGTCEQLAQASLQLAQLRTPLKNTRYAQTPSRCNPP